MPTSYTTAVSVTGYTSGITYGDQLDSLEITSGSTDPFQLPQPPSARASFLGLPTVYGLTQTPDWWIGKEVTFTITPQGATGTVTWTGIVQSYTCSPVQTSSADQIVELELLSPTSRLSTEEVNGTMGYLAWSSLYNQLNIQLGKLSWAEAPAGLTWTKVVGSWDNYSNNKSQLVFANDSMPATYHSAILGGTDILSTLTLVFLNKLRGWFWFDNKTITMNAPTSYTNYTAITSLDATSCILWSSLSVSQDFNNIINSGTITNASASVTSTYIDSTSYNQYGNRPYDAGASWESDTADQVSVITNIVNAYKQPNKYLQSFTVNLDALTHTTGEWQNFYKSTKPVRLPITNIPAAYGGNHTYMVRGVQLNLTQKHAEATLLVVPSTIYNPS